jgi:NADH:ubiquinone oxidoreductase subunit 3 (subunit A)
MTQLLLIPPVAFVLYLLLVGALSGIGRLLAGPERPNSLKDDTYSSGEAAPSGTAVPGYRSFFTVALFFAILHLGGLMLGTMELTPIALLYLVGLMLALLALILG